MNSPSPAGPDLSGHSLIGHSAIEPGLIGHRAVEGWGVLERATDLARSGEAFVLATVVWREGPTSGQQGSRAIYTASGEMYGWIGGACAEPVFIREAIAALDAGTPRLLALGASDRFGDLPQGTTAVPMSCQSEGALQIYLEPVVATPHLVIVGSSPMATTLSVLAAQLDWRVELVDGAGFSEGLLTPQSMVVVATQGHGDEDVLAAAFKADPAYVGLVSSARRGRSVRELLGTQGIDAARLDALRAPAGLDLGSTTHKEVAVSILAEARAVARPGSVCRPGRRAGAHDGDRCRSCLRHDGPDRCGDAVAEDRRRGRLLLLRRLPHCL